MQKTFYKSISGIKASLIRGILEIGTLPDKAYTLTVAIIKSVYRMCKSKKHLLEWMTAEEAEKNLKTDIFSYYKSMWPNILLGLIFLVFSYINPLYLILSLLWIVTPGVMKYISKKEQELYSIDYLNKIEQEYLLDIGKRTWAFFKDNLTEKSNFLPPDNYQEDRKEKLVYRTSPTNIGLGLLAVASSYDLGFENLNDTINLLSKMIESISKMQKWNGHLYNWYNIENLEPLNPKYVSTVDSGNFVGYLYTLKQFLDDIQVKLKNDIDANKINESINLMIEIIEGLINNTDFKYLYSEENRIFSIGFNVEDNTLTPSYYDLLASEARQASLIAIAKKDIPSKHWNYLGRTLTTLGKYKGLISWSGTAFEYLMPNINIPKYEGSLLDESCKFMIKSQIEYSKKLNLPWGISEAAFNLKDLHSNYQYKAFGIPWLGLKRGLADEMVVSSYGGFLAINDVPKEELINLKRLEKEGMYDKFGFYESIDYTPQRVEKGKTSSVVKTYMAHHQGLILLSINNLFNKDILVKRFMKNPEMEAVGILLQETMPETFIITKEKKEKVEKLKYKDYEDYMKNTYKKIDERLIRANVISNENYMVAMNQKGQGVSKYKDLYINRFKPTEDYPQGIFFAIKNIKNKNIWSSNYSFNENKNQYTISFMPDKDEQEITNGNIKTKIKTTVASNEPVEIRRLTLENEGLEEEILEVNTYFEPILSKKEQDYAHPAFNNLFLITKFDEETKSLIIKRKNREPNGKKVYLAVNLSTNSETVGDFEYEIEEEKYIGRGNLGIPNKIKNSNPLSKKIGLALEPIIALKRTVKIKPNTKATLDLIISVNENKEKALENIKKYKSIENVKKEFELSKARVEAESRYLRMKGSEIELYQKLLSYIIFDNPIKSKQMENINKGTNFKQSELWKYGISGDLPIILVKIKNVNDRICSKRSTKSL